MTSPDINLENRISTAEKDIEGIRFYNEELANALARLVIEVTNSVISTDEFKEEIRRDTKVLKEELKKFKEEMGNDTRKFREEIRRDTKVLKEELKKFKEEMGNDTRKFREGIRRDTKVLKEELKEFKEEIRNDTRKFKEEMKQSKKDLDKKWGDLANKMGTVIEDLITPSVPTAIKKAFGQNIINSADHIRRYNKKLNLRMEIDVLANSDDTLYIIESKTTVSKDKVDVFENKFKSGKFDKLFPEYNDFRVVLILASIKIPENIIEYIHEKGMYPMVYIGDMMEIITAN